MLFNSAIFLPFILIVLGLYYNLRRRGQNRMLLAASYIFYGWWDWRFAGLLLFSTIMDFMLAIAIDSAPTPRRRRALMLVSVCVNFGILGFFKYFNFFADSLHAVLRSVGFEPDWPTLNIILPVGISFYTFQTMNYTIDVYRRLLKPERDLTTFALFVSYFPHMVAGPIMRAEKLLPQLANARHISRDQVISGLWLILWGYFKKMVIADNLAGHVAGVFEGSDPLSGVRCLLAIYAFAFQIYCDFSGYSDIARGLSKLMGIELMVNFNLPYLARNPSDFWRRWHISLSTWLRDYLFIPLGGSRGTRWKTYRNLFITMLLGGLWHGAAWHFVLWGGYHGLILAIHRYLIRDRHAPESTNKLWHLCCIVGMFQLTCFGWLLFRAKTMGQIVEFLRQICCNFNLRSLSQSAELIFALGLYLSLLWAFELWLRNTDDPRARPGWSRGLGYAAVAVLIVSLVILAAPPGASFIYFAF